MPMESQGEHNSVTASSSTTEVDGDSTKNIKPQRYFKKIHTLEKFCN